MQSLSGLESLFPKDRLLCDPAYLAAFESDGLTAFRTKPRAVVIPETSEEVIAVVRWCNQHEVPFVARGSGTSLSGGSLPVAEGIVIALNRLNQLRHPFCDLISPHTNNDIQTPFFVFRVQHVT